MMGKGWKSYAIALLLGVVSVAHSQGWIDDGTKDTITTILIGGGLAAIRHGIATSAPK